jgi:hypothetical protein
MTNPDPMTADAVQAWRTATAVAVWVTDLRVADSDALELLGGALEDMADAARAGDADAAAVLHALVAAATPTTDHDALEG